ncbi:hypothetical protein [Spiroplasma poulsonii]|nr:hypothetical protein [Spiroplasma poulsonii]
MPTDKMFMVLGRRAYLGLTPAYLKVIGSQAQLKAMVNGELYEIPQWEFLYQKVFI